MSPPVRWVVGRTLAAILLSFLSILFFDPMAAIVVILLGNLALALVWVAPK